MHLLLSLFTLTVTATLLLHHSHTATIPNDAASLLAFKSKADRHNLLHFTLHHPLDYCQWQGVKCQHSRVVRFSLPNTPLGGTFPPNSLTLLPHLRVLVLSNTSLSGPLPPNLHLLPNLRSLLLPHNSFSSSLPPSLFSLLHLRVIDLSFNLFSSPLSPLFLNLDSLTSLKLHSNFFNGSLPPFNQSSLLFFNVSSNNLSGPIPSTPTLARFPLSSFSLNPLLCGEFINRPCHSPSPFFDSSANQPSNSTSIDDGNNSSDSSSLLSPPQSKLHRKRRVMILGFSLGGLLLVSSLLCMFLLAAKKKKKKKTKSKNDDHSHSAVTGEVMAEREVIRVRLDSQEKGNEFVGGGGKRREKSGDLVFCDGEENQLYNLEQLMRGSAEMLGRGLMGTTYKAKLDNQLIVTVKRLDAIRMSGVNSERFEKLMGTVGSMRHPNLVPVRAYFQANDERLIIFDYQPNGSVFNLIHGTTFNALIIPLS